MSLWCHTRGRATDDNNTTVGGYDRRGIDRDVIEVVRSESFVRLRGKLAACPAPWCWGLVLVRGDAMQQQQRWIAGGLGNRMACRCRRAGRCVGVSGGAGGVGHLAQMNVAFSCVRLARGCEQGACSAIAEDQNILCVVEEFHFLGESKSAKHVPPLPVTNFLESLIWPSNCAE